MSSIITHGGKALLSPNGKTINFDALINQANETTGASDVTLTDAVQTLCDGYDISLLVDPYQKWEEWFNRSIKTLSLQATFSSMIDFGDPTNSTRLGQCRYFSMKNFNGDIDGLYRLSGLGRFSGANYKYFLCIGKAKTISYSGCLACSYVDTFVLTYRDELVTIPIFDRMWREPSVFYVPSEFVNDYKNATNWVNYADKIKGFSEAPDYNNTQLYEISDVCKYNQKFYAYRTEDLSSIRGKAPSGTTANTDYWEYIAEV